MHEEKKGKIGRFNGATGRRVTRRAEGSGRFCEDDGRFANGSNRDSVVRSGERLLGSFVSVEKGTYCCREIACSNSVLRTVSSYLCIGRSPTISAALPRSTKARRYSFSTHASPRERESVSRWKIHPSAANERYTLQQTKNVWYECENRIRAARAEKDR